MVGVKLVMVVLITVLTTCSIGFKFSGFVDWPWVIVLLPIIVPTLFLVILAIVGLIWVIFYSLKELFKIEKAN